MAFKNLTKYSTIWKLMLGRISLRAIALWLLVPSKVNKTRIELACIYFSICSFRYRDDFPLSTLKVRNRIVYSHLKRTGSQCNGNKIDVICSLCQTDKHSSTLAVAVLSKHNEDTFLVFNIKLMLLKINYFKKP